MGSYIDWIVKHTFSRLRDGELEKIKRIPEAEEVIQEIQALVPEEIWRHKEDVKYHLRVCPRKKS
jgi:hypothetical protein